jgi:hypothetical protein
MTDDRNLTSHTYDEDLAEGLYHKLYEHYELMKEVLEIIKRQIK